MVWAGGLDAQYRDALVRPHVVYNRIDVQTRFGTVLQADLPFIDGSVRATLNSRVARVLSLSVDRSWFPLKADGSVDTGGLLAPFGNRLIAWRGIRYGDGSFVRFPVFYGRIESVSMRRDGSMSVVGNDLAADVVDSLFETPQSSVTTNSITDEFRRLVRGALSDATFGSSDESGGTVPALTWQSDRAQALDDMSATAGALWYPLADGSFVQRFTPWTKPGLTPVLAFADGTNAAPGTYQIISDWAISVSRTSVNNSIVFTSERQDGSAPVFAIVRDVDPTSPTYFLGQFGRKPLLIQNQSALSQSQCVSAAQTLLRSAKAITQTWDPVSVVPDASLELGDLISMRAEGAASPQVIVGFTLPLRETGDMSLSLRAYSPVTT